MGLFSFFTRQHEKDDPVFGHLVFDEDTWRGEMVIPELSAESLELAIDAGRKEDLAIFHPTLQVIRQNHHQIKALIAEAAFQKYIDFVAEDLKQGNCSEEELAKYPKVTGKDDVWSILLPKALCLSQCEPNYDWCLFLDVSWQTPQYFVVYFRGTVLYKFNVDVEDEDDE